MHRVHRHSRPDRRDEGIALITALAMLLIFSMLGTAYVSYMSLEQETTRYEVRGMRADQLARGGLHAAVGEIQAALEAGALPQDAYTFQIPIYVLEAGALTASPKTVSVSVADESAKINVNHTPRQVLEALGIERGSVRALKSSLPKPGAPNQGGLRWLASIGELRTRGFLRAQPFEALNKDILTVHTVEDYGKPARFINLNSATPPVLAAVFGITLQEAEVLARTRPFITWEDTVTKTGKDPNTYNINPTPQAMQAMPLELALDSRCYRLISEARLSVRGSRSREIRSTVEAVVLIGTDGAYEFRFWRESSGEDIEQAAAPEAEAAEEITAETEDAPAQERTAPPVAKPAPAAPMRGELPSPPGGT